MSDRLTAALARTGRAPGWQEDVWSLVVWAAIGSGQWIDVSPETDIAARREGGGDPEAALAEMAPVLAGESADVVVAAAWHGLSQVAKRRRNEAISVIAEAVSDRQIARALSLTHPAIGVIRTGRQRNGSRRQHRQQRPPGHTGGE